MKPYNVTIEYKHLKITIEATSPDTIIDAYLIGSGVIEGASKLGQVKPKLTTTAWLRKKKEKGKDS